MAVSIKDINDVLVGECGVHVSFITVTRGEEEEHEIRCASLCSVCV